MAEAEMVQAPDLNPVEELAEEPQNPDEKKTPEKIKCKTEMAAAMFHI